MRMDSLRIFTSFIHELLGVTILPLHGKQDNVSPSFPTSMHSWRTDIRDYGEGGMSVLQECIEVGRKGDTLSYFP
jgi:hypothetical protein